MGEGFGSLPSKLRAKRRGGARPERREADDEPTELLCISSYDRNIESGTCNLWRAAVSVDEGGGPDARSRSASSVGPTLNVLVLVLNLRESMWAGPSFERGEGR